MGYITEAGWDLISDLVGEALKNRKTKIKLIVGIDDTKITKPSLLTRFEELRKSVKPRFKWRVFDTRDDSIDFKFHPKLYFCSIPNYIYCLIGSANLTVDGLTENYEAVEYREISKRSDDAKEIESLFEGWWNTAEEWTESLIEEYEVDWIHENEEWISLLTRNGSLVFAGIDYTGYQYKIPDHYLSKLGVQTSDIKLGAIEMKDKKEATVYFYQSVTKKKGNKVYIGNPFAGYSRSVKAINYNYGFKLPINFVGVDFLYMPKYVEKAWINELAKLDVKLGKLKTEIKKSRKTSWERISLDISKLDKRIKKIEGKRRTEKRDKLLSQLRERIQTKFGVFYDNLDGKLKIERIRLDPSVINFRVEEKVSNEPSEYLFRNQMKVVDKLHKAFVISFVKTLREDIIDRLNSGKFALSFDVIRQKNFYGDKMVSEWLNRAKSIDKNEKDELIEEIEKHISEIDKWEDMDKATVIGKFEALY